MKYITVLVFLLTVSYVLSATIIKPKKIAPPAAKHPTYHSKIPNTLHQYANVEYPNVFEWGYRRGDPASHIRGQIFNQKGSHIKYIDILS